MLCRYLGVPKGFVQNSHHHLFTPYFLNAGFTSTCRRYWFLHCCRERGDVESALEEERAGGEGGEKGKKDGGYSATFADVLGLCAGDWRLILVAFVNLLLAAVSQVRGLWVGPFAAAHIILTNSKSFVPRNVGPVCRLSSNCLYFNDRTIEQALFFMTYVRSVGQGTSRPIAWTQSINRSISHATNQPISLSHRHDGSINQPTNQSATYINMTTRPTDQPMTSAQSIDQLTNQSTNHIHMTHNTTNQSHSHNRSISQPINHITST